MALVTVGNSHVGNKYLYEYEFEYEDEEEEGEYYYEYIEMDFFLDGWFAGYWIRLPTATYENKIKLHIYQRYPTHPDYADYVGRCRSEICPVIYKCDSNGAFTELMNSEVVLVTKPETYNGWIDCEVVLKRNLNAGDYVFGGFYVFSANPVWDESSNGINGTIVERLYSCTPSNSDYITQIIRNGRILLYNSRDLVDKYNYSLYFQYYNSPLRTDYVRNVASSSRLASLLTRKAKVKISKTETKAVVDNATRKLIACRIHFESKNINDFSARNMEAIRNFFENETVQDASVRSTGFVRMFFENIGFIDFAVRLFGWVCNVFSVVGGSDLAERSGIYRREENSESNIISSVVAGRVIFRVVATAFGAWDWLKSKIRNENCVVELFCPIADVLELECKI